MSIRNVAVLGTLTVLTLGAQVVMPDVALARRHGLAKGVQVRPDGSATSTVWSGYVVDGALGSVTDVKGSWIVPAVTCSPSGSASSSFWIGIDGYLPTSSTVEQIGTQSNCSSGSAQYAAWYEFYPLPEVVINNFTIMPGDQISAEVRFGSGLFTLTITDVTTGISAAPITGTAPAAARSSAEWIAEDPTALNGILQPLANFGTAEYGLDTTGVANTCGATVGTKAGTIGSFAGATKITMINGGFSEAVPSPLSADGTSFSVTTQPLTTLLTFNGADGQAPVGSLTQGLDGNLYGMTTLGGGDGNVFKITTSGVLTVLQNFNGIDGADPYPGLNLATSGNFYGTTVLGGDGSNDGVIFEITPKGTLTTLVLLNPPLGVNPYGGLVQGTDGNFYGTTSAGGMPDGSGMGTVFKITPSGTLTTLHTFNFTDGATPQATLIQGTDGSFYGTTTSGGANNYGTIFKVTSTGTFTLLYSFSGPDGITPSFGPLIQAADGNFYGTAEGGGSAGLGTIYKMTSGGTVTVVYSFLGSTDGYSPVGGLIQATDGNLYGTTAYGGIGNFGTIFQIATKNPLLNTLYSFSGPDGANPLDSLTQATDGDLYGTTNGGHSGYLGSVFGMNIGLGPFVKTLPLSAKVGKSVKILGTNLLGTTVVAFNGKAATFSIVSPSEITATVPAGATTGKLQVTTPSGVLSSNVNFRVTK